jgi:hypothetical protein
MKILGNVRTAHHSLCLTMIKIITHTEINISQIRCVFPLCQEKLFETSFMPINTSQVKLDMCAEMHIRLHAASVILAWC